ncbi:MAG: sugar ABC transporter permease, partial [Gaiellaceae bacterium]
MSGASVTAEPPAKGAPPAAEPGRWRKHAVTAGFLAPAAFFLGLFILYPVVRTVARSFFDRSGDVFVGIDNYTELFNDPNTVTAIKNNAIWVGVVPAVVTAIGLIFAVMTERVSWSVAFKTVVFMPMAISLFAAGIIWRAAMYQQDPDDGAINAAISVVADAVSPSGPLTRAQPSTENVTGTPQGGLTLQEAIQPGAVATIGLTGIRAAEIPEDAEQAVLPEAAQGGISGVVWRDFSPGGGTAGEVEGEELGLPRVTVELRDPDGATLESTTTEANGTFVF